MKYHHRNVRWSKLPVELLQHIAKFLNNNLQDLGNYRLVCKKWRRSTAISTLFPYNIGSNTLLSSSVYLLRFPRGSGLPWIVTSVEITKGKFQLYHPLLGESLLHIPQNFKLQKFHRSHLVKHYHMAHHVCRTKNSVFCLGKVLVISRYQSFAFTVDDCSLLVLFEWDQLAWYPSIKPQNQYGSELQWLELTYNTVKKFDDILSFNGVIYIVDRLGRLYQLITKQLPYPVLEIVVSSLVVSTNNEWKKRLVGSSSDGKLYMVVMDDQKDVLQVYMLSKSTNDVAWIWIQVHSFLDNDQVLFLSKGYGFFAPARKFPDGQLSNCIFFYDEFPPYFDIHQKFPDKVKDAKQIQVFWLGKYTHEFKPFSSYPGFPINFFSPPNWVFRAHTSFQQSHFRRGFEKKRMQFATNSHDSYVPPHKRYTEFLSMSEAQAIITGTPATMNEVEQKVREESSLETLGKVSGTQSVSRAYITSITQGNASDNLIVKFEGFGIKSNLLLVLQNIWSKHGSIVEDSIIRNGDMVARALESLATVMLILKENSARSLSDCQADYLSSTLSDLKSIRFKVDWLVPCVEKALTLHKSKPLLDSLNELRQCKARAVERRSKLLRKLAEVDTMEKELEENIASRSKVLSFCEDVDLDQPLARDFP